MKKKIAVILAFILAFGMTTMASAATTASNKISDIVGEGSFSSSLGSITVDQKSTSLSGLFDVEVHAKSEIRIYLTGPMFVDAKGVALPKATKITESMLRTGKITVRAMVDSGATALGKVAFATDKTKGAYIKIPFVEEFASLKDVTFEMRIFLYVDKTRKAYTQMDVNGTLSNKVVEVFDGDDYVSTAKSEVLYAQDKIASIDIDLGNGIYITRALVKNKKYYGVAKDTITEADEAVLTKNPAIDAVYTLTTINLKTTGNIVHFEYDDTYYVYDAKGNLLGTTDDAVPYMDKYYMASTKFKMI